MIATTVGAVAKKLLIPGEVLTPLGLTTRGMFLRLADRWVIFLSNEPFRGPLTINIAGVFEQLDHLVDTDAVTTPDGIVFPAAGISISTHRAEVWQPPVRPYKYLPSDQTGAILRQTTRSLTSQKRAGGFGDLLSYLLGELAEAEAAQSGVLPLFKNLHESLRASHIESSLRALEPLLGFGSGLTPSGDDLMAGLLLALNRWGDVLAPLLDIIQLNHAVLEIAYAKTTTLSANIIECATAGQADERLITALDGLLTGAPGAVECASLFSQWGNSSGIDALCGIALVLLKA